MTTKSFSKKEAIHYGWKMLKSNFRFFFLLIIILFLTRFIPQVFISLASGGKSEGNLLTFLLSIAAWIISLIVTIGLIKISLKLHDHRKVHYKELFSGINLIIPYLLSSILYVLIVAGGVILLIVPGIFWALKFHFYSFFIVEKNMGPIEALKASAKITKGVKWNLFIVLAFLRVINVIAGYILFGIGFIVTIPVSMMTEAYIFRKLYERE